MAVQYGCASGRDPAAFLYRGPTICFLPNRIRLRCFFSTTILACMHRGRDPCNPIGSCLLAHAGDHQSHTRSSFRLPVPSPLLHHIAASPLPLLQPLRLVGFSPQGDSSFPRGRDHADLFASPSLHYRLGNAGTANRDDSAYVYIGNSSPSFSSSLQQRRGSTMLHNCHTV